MTFRLNPGGVIGAVLLLAAVMGIAVLTSNPDDIGRRVGGFGDIANVTSRFSTPNAANA